MQLQLYVPVSSPPQEIKTGPFQVYIHASFNYRRSG